MNSGEDLFMEERMHRMTALFWLLLCLIIPVRPAMGEQRLSDGRPPVFLNHVIVYLDSASYNTVANSDFLTNTFANCKERTVTTGSGKPSWTGIYVTGENTYIEFFNIGNQENLGYSNIAFSVDAEGGIARLFDYCTGSGISNVHRSMNTREINGVTLPWFEIFGIIPKDTTASFITGTFVMEYQKEYMVARFPGLSPDSIEITRKLYNRESYRSDLLLQDIIEIELAVDEPDYSKISNDLKLYGYKIEQNEEITSAIGPEIKVILKPKSENLAGICRIRFSLTDEPYKEHTEVFSNKSRLVLNSDRTADWYFYIK